MPTITAVEVLSGILDYYSQQPVYTFTGGQDFDQSVTMTGATTAIQGRDYGYNALGTTARPVAARKTVWHFLHRYGVNEDWNTLKDAMQLAFGHGRPIYLQKTRPDGKVLIAEAVLDDFPDKTVTDSHFKAEFTLTFEQRGDWMTQILNQPRYDTGLTYDSGLKYDTQGLQFPCTGAVTPFDITNGGTVNEKESFLRFNGPMTGPITLVNTSCDVRGIPFGVGPPGAPMYIELFLNLGSTEFLQIDNRTNTVISSVAGIVPWAQVVKAPGQRAYFEFPPGLSHCQVQKGDVSAAGSLFVISRDRYR